MGNRNFISFPSPDGYRVVVSPVGVNVKPLAAQPVANLAGKRFCRAWPVSGPARGKAGRLSGSNQDCRASRIHDRSQSRQCGEFRPWNRRDHVTGRIVPAVWRAASVLIPGRLTSRRCDAWRAGCFVGAGWPAGGPQAGGAVPDMAAGLAMARSF